MNVNFEKAKIVGNVQINQHLDKIINDELKVSESMKILYENNFDEYSLSKILSVGVLGLKKTDVWCRRDGASLPAMI